MFQAKGSPTFLCLFLLKAARFIFGFSVSDLFFRIASFVWMELDRRRLQRLECVQGFASYHVRIRAFALDSAPTVDGRRLPFTQRRIFVAV